MPQSQYRARQVAAKTHEVVEYDHDDSKPGKPLHILIPGGFVALASLGTIILVAYLTWFDGRLDQSTGTVMILLVAPFYVGGVFLFSYGYELYNIPRAIRLTVIIVFLTAAAVVIVAVLALALGAGGKIPGGGSSKKKSSGGGGGKALAKSVQSSTSSSGSSGFSGLGNVVVLGGSGRTHTREVTREVIKEVEVPIVPKPIDCPYCSRSYVPVEHEYICPSCGATTPDELIDMSQEPRERE
jgi:DNA-directed RNA polymerase subunit RPC12/RpoP